MNNLLNKAKYGAPECKIVEFSKSDIIITSNDIGVDYQQQNWGEHLDNPFISSEN